MSIISLLLTILPYILLLFIAIEHRRLRQQIDQDKQFLLSRATINCNLLNQCLDAVERFDDYIENRSDDGTLVGQLADIRNRLRVAQLNKEVVWNRIYELQHIGINHHKVISANQRRLFHAQH